MPPADTDQEPEVTADEARNFVGTPGLIKSLQTLDQVRDALVLHLGGQVDVVLAVSEQLIGLEATRIHVIKTWQS